MIAFSDAPLLCCICSRLTSEICQAPIKQTANDRVRYDALRILADGLEQAGDAEGGAGCRRVAEGILDVFLREGGRELQVPGYEWLPEQNP